MKNIPQSLETELHTFIYQSHPSLTQKCCSNTLTGQACKQSVWPLPHTRHITTLHNTNSTSKEATRAHITASKNTTHSYKVGALDPEKCSTYIIWKLTGGADNKQLSPEHGGRKKSKIGKTNTGDVIKAKWQALCEKDWRVYSYLLLPGFQYQHHREHIRCFPFHWLTHKEKPALFEENENTTKRLIYRQTPLNKQLIMPGY